MSAFDKQLADALEKHGSSLKPRLGWKRRVWQDALSEQSVTRRFSWLSATAVALTVMCVGLGVWNYQLRHESKTRSDAKAPAIDEVEGDIRRFSAEIDVLVMERDILRQQAALAASAEERRQLERILLLKENAVAARRTQITELRSLGKTKGKIKSEAKAGFPTCDPADPLCGL